MNLINFKAWENHILVYTIFRKNYSTLLFMKQITKIHVYNQYVISISEKKNGFNSQKFILTWSLFKACEKIMIQSIFLDKGSCQQKKCQQTCYSFFFCAAKRNYWLFEAETPLLYWQIKQKYWQKVYDLKGQWAYWKETTDIIFPFGFWWYAL
jgi:hypothetical protein